MAWCVYCRAVIPDDAERCPSCGKPLTDGSKVIKCPSCGKYILKNSKQCRFCGVDPHAEIPAEDAAPAEEGVSAQQPAPARRPAPAVETKQAPPPKRRKWFLLPLILLLAVGLFFGARALFFRKDSSEQTREEYVASCKTVSYGMVSRNPKRYAGERLTFSGTVTALVEGGTLVMHIDQFNPEAFSGSDAWYALYTPALDEPLLYVGEEITLYGECLGSETYALRPGEPVTIPSIRIEYYESAVLANLAVRGDPVFGVGETWTEDGLFSLTVTGVRQAETRGSGAEKAPEAAYYIDYSYTNLGYESETSRGIYIAIDGAVIDSAGKAGYAYSAPIENEPYSAPVGETCEATCCIGLDNDGPFQLTVSVNDALFNPHTAKFHLAPPQ